MKETRNLYVTLTETELRGYSDELARITTAFYETEAEKKSVMTGFKDKLDKIGLDTRVLARIISTRRELREVECEWTRDYEAQKAFLYRMDTGELVDNRRLTEDEIQQRLPGLEAEPAEDKVPE
jgi:hypothetical protein